MSIISYTVLLYIPSVLSPQTLPKHQMDYAAQIQVHHFISQISLQITLHRINVQ